MKKPIALLLFVVVAIAGLLACQSGAPPVDGVGRMVMVSYDAVGADMLGVWLANAVIDDPDGFAAMAEHGYAAGRLRPVNPTLTATTHVSMITGRPPSAHGVVSNDFRKVGTPISERANGFAVPYQAETLWTAARRQGRRVGVLLWPTSDARGVERMADFGVIWPVRPAARSEILELDPAEAAPLDELPSADGVVALLWRVEVALPGTELGGRYLVAALDASPDGSPRYDQVAVRRQDEVSWTYVAERDWVQLRAQAQADDDLRASTYGGWCKVLHLDRHRGNLRFYRGAFWRLIAYPADFQQRLFHSVGPWPGPPDGHAVSQWWLDAEQGIDLDTYLEQVERLDRYIDRMADFVFNKEDFRLLLSYHPAVDEYMHSSHIVHPGQWAYSPGRALAAGEGLKRVARSVDLSVGNMWRNLDASRDALVVVSDHGMLPLHHSVRINLVLERAGLLEVDRSGARPRPAASSQMVAASSAACSHLYLNLEGREPGGVVPRIRSAEVLHRAARALADLEVDGAPVVERVVSREQAPALGLGHRNSGDLIVFFAPGFAARDSLDGEIIEVSRTYAQHGYLNHHEALCGVFFARGAGIKAKSPKEVQGTEVAPIVAHWMGLRFPSGG